MGLKRFRLLVVGTAVAVVGSSAPLLAFPIPFFGGKSVCKADRERLGHDERILRDRQQLAFDQCRAGAGGEKSQRCEDLKAQQKSEMRRFQDQRKRTLDDCRYRAENPNSAASTQTATNTKGATGTKSATSTKSAKTPSKQK